MTVAEKAANVGHDCADECELLGGQIRLKQPLKGNRASIDGILLAAFTPVKKGDQVLDFGTGLGTVALAVLARNPTAQLVAIDNDMHILDFARKNAELNGCGQQMQVVCLNLQANASAFEQNGISPASFDAVTANPPYFPEGTVRVPKEEGRKSAFVADQDLLEDWCRAAVRHLKPSGHFAMVHLPEALPDILKRMDRRFGSIEVLPVHARHDQPAIRILVRGLKGSRAPLNILPPLVLHPNAGSAYTEDAERVLRQLSALPLRRPSK